MTFTLGLLASTSSGIEWSRPLMMGWLVIALTLGFIELWLLTDGFSSRKRVAAAAGRSKHTSDQPSFKEMT